MRDFQSAAAVFEEWLGERVHIVGERFTVVDIVMTHTLFWATWNDLLDGLPRLERYMGRHLRRLTRRIVASTIGTAKRYAGCRVRFVRMGCSRDERTCR